MEFNTLVIKNPEHVAKAIRLLDGQLNQAMEYAYIQIEWSNIRHKNPELEHDTYIISVHLEARDNNTPEYTYIQPSIILDGKTTNFLNKMFSSYNPKVVEKLSEATCFKFLVHISDITKVFSEVGPLRNLKLELSPLVLSILSKGTS